MYIWLGHVAVQRHCTILLFVLVYLGMWSCRFVYCIVVYWFFFFHKVWLLNTIKKKNYKKRISFPKGSSG